MSVEIENQLEQIEEYIINDNFSDALRIIKKLPSIEKITTEDELIGLALKCEILNKQGDFDKANKLADEILNKSKEIKDAKIVKIDALIQKSYAEALLGKYGVASACFKEADFIFEKLSNYSTKEIEKRKAKYYNSQSNFYFSRWNLSEGLKYAKKCLRIAKKIKNQELILISNFYLTSFYLYKRDYEMLEKKLVGYKKLAESYQSDLFIGLGYFLQADLIRFTVFDFQKAIETYQKCISYLEKSGSKYILYTIYSNFGGLYRDMFELDEALECYQKSLELIKVKPALGIVKNHLGSIYRLKGDFDEALENYLEALKLFNQMDMTFLIPGQLYSIIEIFVEKDNLKEAKKYLKQFEQFSNKTDMKSSKHVYKYCNALVLKASKGYSNLANAILIFKELLETDLSIDWIIKIVLNLTEILLWELEETDDPNTIAEVSKYLKQLQDIAGEYQYNFFRIDVSNLLANFHLYVSNYGEALDVLNDTLLLASEKGLLMYVTEIEEEIRNITTKINYLKKLDVESLTIEQKEILSNLQERHKDIQTKTKLEKRDNMGEIIGYEAIFAVSF
ncbi:MAG: tetratricopeptide repeat protein [Asgard group archaeon]|nr:tetratricopeptide repeat protein [Asgard group archaeon]